MSVGLSPMSAAVMSRRLTLTERVRAMYTPGRVGVMFDTQDLSTMYTTRAGSTLIGTPGNGTAQFVGRWQDKSGGGYHALAPNDTTGRPQLSARVNLLLATATLSTQSVTTVATGYTLRFTGAGTITLSGTATGSFSAGSHAVTCTAGTLTLTVAGAVNDADLRPTNIHAAGSIPAYQRVVDAETYDSNGFPFRFIPNGTGQAFQTSTITPGSDTVTAVGGIRQLLTANQMLMETGTSVDIDGAIALYNPAGSTFVNYSRGTIKISRTTTSIPVPSTAVVGMQSDISDDAINCIVNDVVSDVTIADQGTGNYTAQVLNLFSRNGASLWFGGQAFRQAVIFGPALTTAEVTTLQTWINESTKAY